MNMSQAQTWLKGKVFDTDGVSATYTRDGVPVSITAVQARSQYESENAEGLVLHSNTVDWFVRVSEIATFSEPAAGDLVTVSGRVYRVLHVGDDHPWEWADEPNRTLYRVHTKLEGDA